MAHDTEPYYLKDKIAFYALYCAIPQGRGKWKRTFKFFEIEMMIYFFSYLVFNAEKVLIGLFPTFFPPNYLAFIGPCHLPRNTVLLFRIKYTTNIKVIFCSTQQKLFLLSPCISSHISTLLTLSGPCKQEDTCESFHHLV